MPIKRLSMRLIREVLRLHYDHDLSTNLISRACGIARSTCQAQWERSCNLRTYFEGLSISSRIFYVR
jgi:hypothetical protein